MRTITFYSYKGGTGRTLLVANIARYLSTLGQRVVALDLDLEAPGLHYKLSDTSLDSFEEPTSKGVVDYLWQFLSDGQPPDSLTDFVTHLQTNPPEGEIMVMPAGPAPSRHYWQTLSRVSWHDLFFSDPAPGVGFFVELKERIRADLAPDFLLIDARTGITEVGGVATTLLPDALVCMTLHNRENLEGLREALRAIQRTPRLPGENPIDITVVLSRIPMETEDYPEDLLVSDVKEYLTEPAPELEDSVNVRDVLVVHSDPHLQLRERVVVHVDAPGEPSFLLGEYLQVFTRVVPEDAVKPQVEKLTQHALDQFLEEPDIAQSSLETLAEYSSNPVALRALIRVYGVRRQPEQMMEAAFRLWQRLGSADDPVLWAAVKYAFGENEAYLRGTYPLEFAEAVWQTQGEGDLLVGLEIAKAWLEKDPSHAADILQTILSRDPENRDAVVWGIRAFTRAGQTGEAESLVERYSPTLGRDLEFQMAFARLIVVTQSEKLATEFLDQRPIVTANLRRRNAVLWLLVLATAGRFDEALREIPQVLSDPRAIRRPHDLGQLGAAFARSGRQSEFEGTISSMLPPRRADQVMHEVERALRDWAGASGGGRQLW